MAKQTIFRRKHQSGFFVASNATASDDRLSLEARGLLFYILSKPADWRAITTDLMRAGGCGRDRIHRILNELERFGYLERERVHDPETGKFSGVECVFYDVPRTGKPDTDNPEPDNPHLQSNDSTKNGKDTIAPSGAASAKADISCSVGDTKTTQRKRDLLFDVIAEHSFNANGLIDKATGGRVGVLKKAILEAYPNISADNLRAVYEWRKATQPNLTPPRGTGTVLTMIRDYIAAHKRPQADLMSVAIRNTQKMNEGS